MKYLNDVLDAVTAMPADAVIGGVFLALMLTSPLGLAYAVGRRRGKDVAMALVALATAANLIGMAIAAVHARHVENSPNAEWARTPLDSGALPQQSGPSGQRSRPPSRPRLSDIIAARVTPSLLSKGDTDHDGRLSTNEAAVAVAALIRSSASGKETSVDEREIRGMIAEVIEPALQTFGQPPAAPRPAR